MIRLPSGESKIASKACMKFWNSTVPKRTQQLVEAGMDEEILWKCHVDVPNALYGDAED